MTTKRRTAIFLTRLGDRAHERAMCFNRRQMEDQRRQAAEKVAVERRAVKLGLSTCREPDVRFSSHSDQNADINSRRRHAAFADRSVHELAERPRPPVRHGTNWKELRLSAHCGVS
jgi:hypothetical protein